MSRFQHQRHKPPTRLLHPRALVVAMPPMNSHVNLARIVRAAGCCGLTRVVACGNARVDREIARDAMEQVTVEIHRTLPPTLKSLRAEGYRLVGLEQATGSVLLTEYAFARETVLVVGHERQGLTQEVLDLLDDVVEIPIFGRPESHNAATAAAIAMYEYCRQFPLG